MVSTSLERRQTGSATAITAIQGSEELRGRLRDMWTAVAGSWAEHAHYVELRGASITDRMLQLVSLQSGEHVLGVMPR